jgi:hypothetical protein
MMYRVEVAEEGLTCVSIELYVRLWKAYVVRTPEGE